MRAAIEYKSLQQLAVAEEKKESLAGGEVIFSVAFGSGRRDSDLKCKPVAWNDILAMISDRKKGGKIQIIPKKFEEFEALPKIQKDRLKNVPWWIVGVKGTHRSRKEITERTAIMLDIDHLGNEGMIRIWKRLKWNNLQYAAYTSASHAPDRNAPRWRIILPLSEPVRKAEEYAALYIYLTDLLEAGGGMDTACQDWSRLMYLPSYCKDRADVYESRTGEGEAVSVELVRELLAFKKTAKKRIEKIPAEDSGYFTRVNHLDGRELCRRFAFHVWKEERGGRWTYIPGEGAGGGVWFTDKAVQIFYSHHASDPWHGRGQNIWQFVAHYLFNGNTRDGKVQQFFREQYGIEYVAEEAEKDLKDERLKKQDSIAFLKEVSRAGSPYHYFIHTIPIPEEKEYSRDSLYTEIWGVLDRIRNIFIPAREREYNRDCWQMVQLVSNLATCSRGDGLSGATETITDRIVTSAWRPGWMRRRYDALNRDTDPGGLDEARRRCAGLWNWWDESPGGAVEVIEYWIRQVKYGISESARRIILNFWGFEVETGKSTTAKMLSSILEGITYAEYSKAKDAALIGEDGLDREFRIGFRFECPKATRRRSVVLNDIKGGHFKRNYSHIVGFLEYDTIDLERKGVTLKDTVPLYPNYIITTNNMATDFLGKGKDRRMHAVGWDNAIKTTLTDEKELWDALQAWVRSVYVPEERLHDWQNDYYPRMKQEAVVKLPSIEMEEVITGELSERWCSQAYKSWGHRGYIGNWIKKCYPAPVGVDKNQHFNNVCTALNLFAPGCLAQKGGRYFNIKADVLLAAIRGENSEPVETEDISSVSEEECPF